MPNTFGLIRFGFGLVGSSSPYTLKTRQDAESKSYTLHKTIFKSPTNIPQKSHEKIFPQIRRHKYFFLFKLIHKTPLKFPQNVLLI